MDTRPAADDAMDSDVSDRVRGLALARHATQRYGDGRPYGAHLAEVVEVLREHGVTDPVLLAAAWGHDLLEDTPLTRAELVECAGEQVAALVDAVSNRPGPNRAARHAECYPRIAATPGAVAVKLADRIANVRAGGRLLGMYRRERAAFDAALAEADPGAHGPLVTRLWRSLDAAYAEATRRR